MTTRGRPTVRSGLLAAIGFYSRAISPALPPRCRFHPTCSAYAAQAITRHGAARGSWLALRRLLKCAPWHPGGVDLVPGTGSLRAPTAPESTGTSGTSHSSSIAEALPASPADAARRPDLANPPRRRRAPHEESSVA